jgi:hypothetical protein
MRASIFGKGFLNLGDDHAFCGTGRRRNNNKKQGNGPEH